MNIKTMTQSNRKRTISRGKRSCISSFVAASLVLSVSVSHAQEVRYDNTFSWSGVVPAGQKVFVSNINGSIEVSRSSSNRVEVSAEKQWRRGNPEDVRIELKRVGEDLVICALWNEESVCNDDGGISRSSSHFGLRNKSNDVSVKFKLRIPDGVKTNLSSVNGSISVSDASAEVRASSVNGGIAVNNSVGPVKATTVNGGITASLRAVDNASDLSFKTVNGGINIRLPDSFGGQVDLATVSGGINADFPITVSGRISSRRLRGVVGDGRSRLEANTVNGGIRVNRLN